MNILCVIGIHKPCKCGYYVELHHKQYRKHGGGYRWINRAKKYRFCEGCGKVLKKRRIK